MRIRIATVALSMLVAIVLTVPAQGAVKAVKATRYTLQGKCLTLGGATGKAVPGASRLRFKATDLGRYLLYLPDRRFLGASGSASAPAARRAERRHHVDHRGRRSRPLRPAAGVGAEHRADEHRGDSATRRAPPPACSSSAPPAAPSTPRPSLDATGTPSKGDTSYGRVGGLVEGHMHWMTFQYLGGNFHCGRPWYAVRHRLRAARLLEHRGPAGRRRAVPELPQLRQPGPAARHERLPQVHLVEGQPHLRGHYWRWIQRAGTGGLWLMVMSVNENRVLCELQTNRETNCNEMDTVRRGFTAIR